MAVLTSDKVVELIKQPKSEKKIKLARQRSQELNMHVNGVDVKITKIEGYENDKQKKLREVLTRSNKALFQRLLQPVNKVFSAKGGTAEYVIGSEKLRKEFENQKYKGYALNRWIKQKINISRLS